MDIVSAARALAAGDVIAFPTETVYGLGADALNRSAVEKIFTLKGRPSDHPLIVHIATAGDIERWTRDVPAEAWTLARAFWPGPLTMILPRADAMPDAATGGQSSVGLRCPSHPMAQALLREFGRVGSGAIAAPSANRFGHVSPTSAEHVREEFGNGVPVLDGGACEVGLESTIVDLSRGQAVLLRPGGVPRQTLATVLGYEPRDRDGNAPRASGTLAAHYAPATPLQRVEASELAKEIARGGSVAVLSQAEAIHSPHVAVWIKAPQNAVEYGHDLYANLRRLDHSGVDRILVEATPASPAWEAVNDRLARAVAGAGRPNHP